MSDIVERLRAMEPFQSDDWKIAREAADEIERLRAVLHEIKRCNAQYNFGSKLVRLVDGALEQKP